MIKRQDAIDDILNLFDWETVDDIQTSAVMRQIITDIKNLPSAQPEQRTGRWLPDNNSVYEMRFICSECKESHVVPTIGFTTYKPIWDFCPNCGAKMNQ